MKEGRVKYSLTCLQWLRASKGWVGGWRRESQYLQKTSLSHSAPRLSSDSEPQRSHHRLLRPNHHHNRMNGLAAPNGEKNCVDLSTSRVVAMRGFTWLVLQWKFSCAQCSMLCNAMWLLCCDCYAVKAFFFFLLWLSWSAVQRQNFYTI